MYMDKLLKIIVAIFILTLTQCKDDCIKSSKCSLEPNPGPCFASFTRYYYDKNAKQCKPFTFGGCDGVVPFDTLEECKNGCQCD